jgi:hypothetical protein
MKNIKVGDIVIHSYGFNSQRLLKVTKLTATQVVCGDSRFRRVGGSAVGGAAFHTSFIVPVAPGDVEKVLREAKQRKLANLIRTRCKESGLQSLGVETLEKIVALLDW